MSERGKPMWTLGLGVALASVALVGCGQQASDPAPQAGAVDHSMHGTAQVQGERSPASSARDFQNVLGQIRGHLWVGFELFRAGHHAEAVTHMKHPEDELYAELKPAFDAHGIAGFDEALSAFAASVESNADEAAAGAAYARFLQELDRAEAEAGFSTRDRLQGVADLLRAASEEYAIGVDEQGGLSNLHEYQDSLGFTRAAEHLVGSLDDAADPALGTARAGILEAIAPLYDAWPGLMPSGGLVRANAERIDAVAERIDALAAQF